MIALVLAYICLGESQTSKSIRIPPTLLESTEYNDTSCLSTIGLEWRKTEILKIKKTLLPADHVLVEVQGGLECSILI